MFSFPFSKLYFKGQKHAHQAVAIDDVSFIGESCQKLLLSSMPLGEYLFYDIKIVVNEPIESNRQYCGLTSFTSINSISSIK